MIKQSNNNLPTKLVTAIQLNCNKKKYTIYTFLDSPLLLSTIYSPTLSCQTAVQAIKVIFFTIIIKITSSKDKFSPPRDIP